jgi:flagellar basal-body rod modification protein FlgD
MLEPVSSSETPREASTGLAALGPDAFLELLVAQLRYQNPLQPSNPSDMLAQTAMFTTVETLQAISRAQQELLSAQELVGAMGALGRRVSAVLADGTPVTGTVDAVTMSEEGPLLTVEGEQIPFERVTQVEG